MRKNAQNKNGNVIIEFAIMMSLLLAPLLMGMMDISKMIDVN